MLLILKPGSASLSAMPSWYDMTDYHGGRGSRSNWWQSGWDPNAQEANISYWQASISENANSDGWRRDQSATHSWEPASAARSSDPAPIAVSLVPESSGPKRTHAANPSDDQEPCAKRPRIDITEFNEEEINRAGNMVTDEVKWVSQDDLQPLGHPISQALWLVAEKSYGYGIATTWFRPATQLSDLLEAQFQGNIGCQSCTLTYTKDDETTIEHMFEHDLRGEQWAQRRIVFTKELKAEVKSSKQILRVMIG